MGEAAGGEFYNTITYVAESPHEPGTIWVGTDDGLVQVIRGPGAQWENVTPDGLGEARINAIDVSPHDPATAYIAVTRFLLNDPRPLIYKTSDYGQSWTLLAGGLPEDDPVRVVREDPGRKGLLYAGTQRGVYLSFDDGSSWQSLQLNLPTTPITDLAIREHDLVASTEGRGFWILDDLTPLHQVQTVDRDAAVHLFEPRVTYRTEGRSPERGTGQNAPAGATLYYYFSETPTEPVKLEVLDSEGEVVRTYDSEDDERPLAAEAGMNRLIWDLRHEDIQRVPGTFLAADYFGTVPGYRVPPGTYRIRLTVGDTTAESGLEVVKDPRVAATAEDFAEAGRLLASIRESINDIHRTVIVVQKLREQVEVSVAATEGLESAETIAEAGSKLTKKLSELEERLMQPRLETIMDAVNFQTMLNEQFLYLKGAVASADARPTQGAMERFEELQAKWQTLKSDLGRILEEDVAAFNAMFEERNIGVIVVPETP